MHEFQIPRHKPDCKNKVMFEVWDDIGDLFTADDTMHIVNIVHYCTECGVGGYTEQRKIQKRSRT